MEQTTLKLQIGTIESEKTILKPAKLKIVNVEVILVEKAKSDKVVFEVKHPDKEETIKISSVSFLDGREVKTSGTWVSLDKDGNLQKGSALTIFMKTIEVNTLEEAVGKEADSELDGNYLCFKAY